MRPINVTSSDEATEPPFPHVMFRFTCLYLHFVKLDPMMDP